MCSIRFVLISAFGAAALFALALPLGVAAEGAVEAEVATETGTNAPAARMKVRVYYEALCPDSKQFICNQLYYAMFDNNWLEQTDLELVPYGKVSSWTSPVTNQTTLYCQHGHNECELNALHACVVEHNNIDEQLKLIYCMMRSYTGDIDECARRYEIDVTAAKNCKATRSTPEILRKYGVQTDAIEISFVPSIALDGVFKRSQQRSINYNFDGAFCRKYQEKYNVKLEHC